MDLSPVRPACRAYPVFNDLPEGCIAFPITDVDTASIVLPGESVVVDTNDRVLDEGELFVLNHSRATGVHPRVVQTMTRPMLGRGGLRGWWAVPHDRRRAILVDGPYAAGPGEDALRARLVGRVVGIYAGHSAASLAGSALEVEVTSRLMDPQLNAWDCSSNPGATL
jgi:hypothetical protein